jgi:hypothetical protein
MIKNIVIYHLPMKIHLIQKLKELEDLCHQMLEKVNQKKKRRTIHKCYSTLEELRKVSKRN